MYWKDYVEEVMRRRGIKSPKFRKWMMTKEYAGKLWSPVLWKTAYNAYEDMNNNLDHITIIVGRRGMGKSFLGMNYAMVTDETFDMDRCVFDANKYLDIMSSEPYKKAILLDEGGVILFSREAMTPENRQLVKTFNIMRVFNCHLIICVPNYFSLDSYVRNELVNTVIDITNRKEGHVYVKDSVKILNNMGKASSKLGSVNVHPRYKDSWTCNSTFININDVTLERYKSHKLLHTNNLLKKIRESLNTGRSGRDNSEYLTVTQLGAICNVGLSTIRRKIKEGDLPAVRVGAKYMVPKSKIGESAFLGALYKLSTERGNESV